MKRTSKNQIQTLLIVPAFLALASITVAAQDASFRARSTHPAPDADGIYYVGPDVSAPRILRTFAAPYPKDIPAKDVQGMSVLAMVIDAHGIPAHLQILRSHGEAFDRAAIAAVMHSTFVPGRIGQEPVPVWIDVRVVFHTNHSQALPEVFIAERDLPSPGEAQLEDKHHRPLDYAPPFPIHTVDADFANPFVAHPYVEVAVVTVLVSQEGLPKEVRIRRGLGFGLDQKAVAAVWHYRFFPATKRGQPVTASSDVTVAFAKF
jgi:TonB family protein